MQQTFKIRCSAIGEIMTNGKGSNEIGETCKTYVKNWVRSVVYDKRKYFASKYTKKGNECELESLQTIAEYFNLPAVFVEKNTQVFENETMVGTPDLIYDNVLYDAKNSWDCYTFPAFDVELKNKSYWWQMQGYMELTGIRESYVCYVLSDAPDSIVESEAWKVARDRGYDEMTAGLFDEVKENMTYSHLPLKLRVKAFKVEYSEEAIEQIKARVSACQEYANELFKALNY